MHVKTMQKTRRSDVNTRFNIRNKLNAVPVSERVVTYSGVPKLVNTDDARRPALLYSCQQLFCQSGVHISI